MEQKTILVAEDDASFRQTLGNFLHQHGFAVLCVEDGYQALEFAVKDCPDLLVLDVHMPAGDGFSVHERVRKHPALALTPVIYMTHDPSRKVAMEAKEHNAFALMHKPFSLHELLGNIHAALRSSSADAA